MRKWIQFGLPVLILATVVLLGGGVRERKIAVIDMEKLVNAYANDMGAFDELNNEKRARGIALAQKSDAIETMEQELSILKPNSNEFYELGKKVQQEKAAFTFERRSMDRDNDREMGRLIAEIYEKANNAVAAHAAENDIDMVFLTTSAELVRDAGKEYISSAIATRSLVFASNALDITDAIKNRMLK